jgi:2,3-bisphosphoglycerate-independent phosphoglycerate mutase
VEIKPGELATRCNLISIEKGKIKSHSAGHISSDEARELIAYINEKLGSDDIHFYPGVDYRHLLVVKGASNEVKLIPPHDVPGIDAEKVMPKSKNQDGEKTRKLLDSLIRKSWEILAEHPVNMKRLEQGKDPANSIWPWSPGYKPEMETMTGRFGIKGAVISAVDLIRGLGLYAGMDIIPVDGITGKYDTNYEGKADACIEALKKYDFVYLHVEASDEAGHDADIDLKIKTIEFFDKRLIKRVLDNLHKIDDDVAIAVLPDHPTPLEFRTHVREPVPFLINNPKLSPDQVTQYDEESVKAGCYGLLKGDEFIVTFLGNK